MKKILVSLLILVITMVCVDRLGYYLFTHFIAEKNLSGETGGAVNYLLKKKSSVDFIILGSSRAKYHINPALLTNVYNGNGYNAGLNGVGKIVYNEMLLQIMITNGIKPKMIILQTDPPAYTEIKNENFIYELTSLYPYLDENKSLRDFVYSNASYAEKTKLFFKTYRYNGKFAGICYNYLKRNSVKDNNGFEGLSNKMDTASFHLAAIADSSSTFSATKIAAINNIVQTCKAHNIKLVVVFTPTYNNNGFSKMATGKLIQLLSGTTVYDFSDISQIPSLQSPAVWKDGSHLNKEGAAIFSALLNDSLQKKK
jgi:hypothetical protein